MKTVIERLWCPSCGEIVDVRLVRKVGQNGTSFPYWQCQNGHNIRWQGKDWLPRSYIDKLALTYDDLPVETDYRSIPCAVCGELGTELHHTAPRAIFGEDAEYYPQVYLCKSHHDYWHATITAYYTVGGNNGGDD